MRTTTSLGSLLTRASAGVTVLVIVAGLAGCSTSHRSSEAEAGAADATDSTSTATLSGMPHSSGSPGEPVAPASSPPASSASLFGNEPPCDLTSPSPLDPQAAPVVVLWRVGLHTCVVTTGAASLAQRLRSDFAADPSAAPASNAGCSGVGLFAEVWLQGRPAAAVGFAGCAGVRLPDRADLTLTPAVSADLQQIAPPGNDSWFIAPTR